MQSKAIRIRRLADRQLVNFDKEYVEDRKWAAMRACIDREFSEKPFSFLDIGGGNGVFADRILVAYPQSRGVVLDNAQILLQKNTDRGHRKRIVQGCAEDLATLFVGERFDIIFMNWVLHHLVGDSYSSTTANVKHVLCASGGILCDQGRISIFEHMYDGLILDSLPSHIIYHLTSTKRLAPLVRRFGANTAGVGVCFRSRRGWSAIICNAGMEVIRYSESPPWPIRPSHRLLLHMGNIRGGHFWLKRVSLNDSS